MDMGKTPVLAAYKYGCGKLRNGKAKRVRTILNVLEEYSSRFKMDSTYIYIYVHTRTQSVSLTTEV